MSACLALEQPVRVAYLGPAGTFSHAAVAKHFGKFVHGRALRDDRRGVSRGRGRADRLRGGPGRELDRGRRRPHARSHVPDAAVDLRRDQAARAPEPAVECRGARRRDARLLACAVACAVRAVARPPSARRRAGRGREQCRGGATRGARSRAPRPSRARSPPRSTVLASSLRTSRTSPTTRRASGCWDRRTSPRRAATRPRS